MSDLEAIQTIEDDADKTDEDVYAAFQQLINSGTVWVLQGWYGRTALTLIEAGECSHKEPTA